MLTFDSPHRPRGERRAERRLLRHFRVGRHYRARFPTEIGSWVRGGRDRAYVPARNLFFHATAAMVAQAAGISRVAAGHLAADGSAFPDARRAYLDGIEALANAGRRAGAPRVRILTPFVGWRKESVVALGRRWNVPLEWTWSCQRDGARPCGRCVSCRERRRAFATDSAAPRHRARPSVTRAR